MFSALEHIYRNNNGIQLYYYNTIHRKWHSVKNTGSNSFFLLHRKSNPVGTLIWDKLDDTNIKAHALLGRVRRPGVYLKSQWTGQMALWWCTTSVTALPSSMPKTSCGRFGRHAWRTAKGQQKLNNRCCWHIMDVWIGCYLTVILVCYNNACFEMEAKSYIQFYNFKCQMKSSCKESVIRGLK